MFEYEYEYVVAFFHFFLSSYFYKFDIFEIGDDQNKVKRPL